MADNTNTIVQAILSVLMFPLYFQADFLLFAWGTLDPFWIMSGKRLFLLLPVLAFILACWLSIACFITVIFRQNRREFVTDLFVTWWDLGKAIAAFWGGIFKFCYVVLIALFGLARFLVLGVWTLIQDILLLPFRLLSGAGQRLVGSPVPWLAVTMTIVWCLIETGIFTYVTAPLVIDTFSNITGDQLSESAIRIPLFAFLFVVVLGSYAVLSNFVNTVKTKKVGAILGVGAIEIVVMFVEVMFLYREFVDALIPWMAQYSETFDMGIISILSIAVFVWFGVRSLSWFLFASHGTPTLLAIIQGKGLPAAAGKSRKTASGATATPGASGSFLSGLKSEVEWIQQKGEDLLAAFMLPPLQIVAAAINFCALLVNGNHLFQIPFTTMNDIRAGQHLLRQRLQSNGAVKQEREKETMPTG